MMSGPSVASTFIRQWPTLRASRYWNFAIVPSGRCLSTTRRQLVARLAEKAPGGAPQVRGIVHRDLKPSNVMLTPAGEPVIMDFGLARRTELAGRPSCHTGAAARSSARRPICHQNRCAANCAASASRAKMYALGVILYQLLTGRRPYHGGLTVVLARILNPEEPTPLTQYRPDVDPRLAEICRRAMAKSQAERYASMHEFAAVLQSYLCDEPLPAVDLSVADPRRGRPPRKTLAVAGAAGAMFALLAVWVIINNDKNEEGRAVAGSQRWFR